MLDIVIYEEYNCKEYRFTLRHTHTGLVILYVGIMITKKRIE